MVSTTGDQMAQCEGLTHEYSDFRSSSEDRRRERKQKQKYYAYRASNPSMVGQKCYTLTDVVLRNCAGSRTTSSERHGSKGKRRQSVEEVESPDVMKALIKQSPMYMWSWLDDDDSAIIAAAAMADRRRRLSSAPTPVEGSTLSCSFLDQLLEDTKLRAAQILNSYGFYPELPEKGKMRVRLKVRTWTKKDNYDNRVAFKDYYYIGRRHFSRKFSCDGKRYKKTTLREMCRGMKSKSRVIEWYGPRDLPHMILDEADTTQCTTASCGCSQDLCLVRDEEVSEDDNELRETFGEAQNATVEDPLNLFVPVEAYSRRQSSAALRIAANIDVMIVEEASPCSTPEWSLADWTFCSPIDPLSDLDVISVDEDDLESDWEEV